MRRLTPLTLVWRNYLYANNAGDFNNAEDELDFLKQNMMELQMEPKARNNLQWVKQDLERIRTEAGKKGQELLQQADKLLEQAQNWAK